MPDVLRIARERRDALSDEIGRLDDFIQMAETLIGGNRERDDGVSDREFFRARFCVGEVLPPLASAGQ